MIAVSSPFPSNFLTMYMFLPSTFDCCLPLPAGGGGGSRRVLIETRKRPVEVAERFVERARARLGRVVCGLGEFHLAIRVDGS